eukprot:GDKI01037774.1.p1 GENE.GDKI01037774.1~~GDKI01037774.1.p1  ORF type:complete len:157 (+),score=17.09 GDKI01037774.1:22-492(+)
MKDYHTPLHFVQCFDTMRMLLEGGADPNVQHFSVYAPLHCAICTPCDVESIRLLLDKGANVNESKECSVTPLHLAAKKNRPDVTQLLMDRGASINATDYRRQTPLDYAHAHNNTHAWTAHMLAKCTHQCGQHEDTRATKHSKDTHMYVTLVEITRV